MSLKQCAEYTKMPSEDFYCWVRHRTCDRRCSEHEENVLEAKSWEACDAIPFEIAFCVNHFSLMYIRSIAIDKKIGSRGGTYTVCTQFTHASLGTYSPTVCASPLFFQLLLKKVATEPQHYFSAQNECASVLNGTHLFPLQVLRQRCYPPACRITTLYYTPAGRERVGL